MLWRDRKKISNLPWRDPSRPQLGIVVGGDRQRHLAKVHDGARQNCAPVARNCRVDWSMILTGLSYVIDRDQAA
jgi:hypothetical protein